MNDSKDTRNTVQDDVIVTMDYTLKVDGGVVDKTEEAEPIQFIQGHGEIIPGLEKQLYGMSIGESKNIVVPPAEGYGETDANAYADIPRTEFPPQIPLETGVALQLRDQNGDVLDAYITEVRDESVRLNFNHPLAGKELHFTVTVVDLRAATPEEIEHGHAHDAAGHEDEEDYEEEWDDEEEEDDDDDDEYDEWEDEEEEEEEL
jgi:FKBP-type peptidyl-prolyl cis-trans isomerase SlyD